jgi:hypothetical protein
MEEKTLRERCHIDTDDDGDCFVGVKADSNDAIVYFPLGFELPEAEEDVRRDIQHLFRILSEFSEPEDRILHMTKNEAPQTVNFPIRAYLDVMDYYQANGYYSEKEVEYEVRVSGKTDWHKTLSTQKPVIQTEGSQSSLVYLKRVVRLQTPNTNNLITLINKFCVYESYVKLGWLFGTNMPEKPLLKLETQHFIAVLNDKASQTNDDRKKVLFKSMIAMINYMDERTLDKQFYFGTDNFEYVWQSMIDKVFGIRNKDDYFPHASWRERHGSKKGVVKRPLEPDSIMVCGDKFYVLDAKFYKYGSTANVDDLPNSADINKQITYGDYIKSHEKKAGKGLFNAFLMPFSMNKNYFGITQKWLGNVSEAVGNWRQLPFKDFEKIEGIVVDVRYLMYHLEGNHDKEKQMLAEEIESGVNEFIYQ